MTIKFLKIYKLISSMLLITSKVISEQKLTKLYLGNVLLVLSFFSMVIDCPIMMMTEFTTRLISDL